MLLSMSRALRVLKRFFPTQLLHNGTAVPRLVTLVLGLSALMACGSPCPPASESVQLAPVLKGIDVVHGHWPAQQSSGPDHHATTVVLSAGSQATVVDPGPSHRRGQALQEQLRCQHGQRVVRVLNSHAHAEHVLANHAFAAPIAATATTRASMRQRCPACLAALQRDLGQNALRGTRIRLPRQTLHDGQMLHLGDRHWQVLDMHDAHTESDLVLWSAAERIVLVGPLVDRDALVLAQGSVRGWLQALQRIENLNPQWLIGQGIVAGPDQVQSALATQRGALCALVRQVWHGLESGWSEAEALQMLSPANDRQAQHLQQSFNLLRAWRELETLWMDRQSMPGGCQPQTSDGS